MDIIVYLIFSCTSNVARMDGWMDGYMTSHRPSVFGYYNVCADLGHRPTRSSRFGEGEVAALLSRPT